MWGDETGTENICDNGEPSGATHTDFHLRLLRVGTDGSSKEITLGDWASDSSNVAGNVTQTGGIPNVGGTLITNADQGVLYSWGQCLINHTTGLCNPQYNLTTIAADGSPTTVPTNIGGSNVPINSYLLSPVQPVLQRADNSYIGTLTTFPQSSMVAFTSSGQQLWSQPNYAPQIATSGGGVKVEQSGVWSNATTFTVPVSFGGGTSVTMVPNVINLLVGGTQQLQALDSNGNSVTGLIWSSSNTAVATLSTDDPPILTAITPGNTTIMVGTASADVTVFAGSTLPIGTVLWSNPGDGSGVSSIVPAVPSSTGVADVFSLQADGNVLAIKPDGTTAWKAQVGSSSTLIPDFQGGLVVYTGSSIYKLDGMTGQPYQPYTSTAGLAIPVVHTDGTIFTIDGNSIVGIDPLTGQSKFSPVSMPSGSTNYVYDPPVQFCYDSPMHPRAMNISGNSTSATSSPLMIAGDGYMYVSYYANNSTTTYHDFCVYEIQAKATFGLLRVGTAGDSYGIPLGNWSYSASFQQVLNGPDLFTHSGSIPCVIPGSILTNADTGVIFTWELDTYSGGQCSPFGGGSKTTTFNVATTAGSGLASQNTTTSAPGQAGPLQPILQRQDGNFIGTVGIGPQPGQVAQTNMIAFGPSGNPLFNVPNETPQIATSNNGVIGASGIVYDQGGQTTGQLANMPTYSWKGAYQLGSTESVSPDFDQAGIATSFSPVPNGNLAGNGFALVNHTFGLVFCSTDPGGDASSCPNGTDNMQFDYLIGIKDSNYTEAMNYDFSQAYPAWVNTIKINALNAYQTAFDNLPAIVMCRENATMLYGGSPEPASFEHTIYITGRWLVPGRYPRINTPYPPNGYTPAVVGASTFSWVYYLPVMGNTQIGLGNFSANPFVPFSPIYSPPPISQMLNSEFEQLVSSMGSAIGRVSAHETGHQLNLPYMECGDRTPCENGNNYVYQSYSSYGGEEWWYTGSPSLQWSPSAVCALEQYFLPKFSCQ